MITPTPVIFGGAHHIAGWFLARAPGLGFRDSAVLLCPPIGHEYMCSHRAFRILAQKLSALGFPVLRFDYPGTGDSGDPESGGSLLPAWRESVSQAADELRRLSGRDTLSLLGLRFGATLAASTALSRDDVDSLVLWSPVTDGRTLIRQTRMLALASAERPDDLVPESKGIESAGFFLDHATVRDISTMRIPEVTGRGPSDALVLSRDDAPPDETLPRALATAGMTCELLTFPGHAGFLVTPFKSIVPTDAINAIADWLDHRHPATADAIADSASLAHSREVRAILPNGITERAVSIAPGLAGILTEPADETTNPPVILLNTGADHHVGPHRLFTPLAREWAALDFPVLRFDLRGLGDSDDDEALPTSYPYPGSAQDDIRAAIGYLRKAHGFGAPVLVGICSGAYHAMHAVNDGVSAIIAVNAPLYYRPGDPIEEDPYAASVETTRVARALRNRQKWRRLLTGEVDIGYTAAVVASGIAAAGRNATGSLRRFGKRQREEYPQLAGLFDECVPRHLIFSGDDPSHKFFRRVVAQRIPRSATRHDITIDVVKGADHTFMLIKWQEALRALMTERLLQHRSAARASANSTERAART